MHNNKKRLALFDQFRLKVDVFSLLVLAVATLVVKSFPPEQTLFPPYLYSLFVFAVISLHAYGLYSASAGLVNFSEWLILSGGIVMWGIVWVNGELATIVLPGFIALAAIYGLTKSRFLIVYSLGSFALIVATLELHPEAAPAIVGRSAVTTLAVVILVFFLRQHILLLNRSERELITLDATLKSVLAKAKINVFDLRVSTGKGSFLYAYDSNNREFIDQSRWLEMVDPKYRSDLQNNLMQLGTSTEFCVNLPGKDSSPSWHWLREEMIHEYVDESGELHRIGYSQNIDDEVAVREQLLLSLKLQNEEKRKLGIEIEKFDSVCDQLEMVYWRLSLDDWTLSYNNQFARRWNLEPGGSIAFKQLASFMHDFYIDFHERCIQRVIEQRDTVVDQFQAPVGLRVGRWFELRYWPDYDSDENLIAINVSNIEVTDLMQAQEELRQKHEESLRQQRREKDMYAVIAHEMRTPAAILKMQLEQERKGLGQLDRKLFETSVDQLLGVVDTLRTVSQPEQMVSRELSAVLPCELLANQIAILRALAQEQGMDLITDCDSVTDKPLMLMQGPLKQLISNLVKNAILHSGGSQVRLSAECEEQEGGFFELTLFVDDDGRGIPESEIERLFEPYERGEGSISGTGLGLFVCRQIATMMGASLTYVASPDGGARFVLNWMAEVAAQGDTDSGVDSPAYRDQLRNLSVLLVEDDVGILQMTATLLAVECKTLRIAKNGAQALSILADKPIDLVLTDIFMPEMNGIELVRQMRQRGYAHPVVGLTAATLGQETANLLQVGANAVMNKPVDIDELKRIVAEFDAQSDMV